MPPTNNAKLKCAECNRTKLVHLFYKKPTKTGYSTKCKSCFKKSDSYRKVKDRYYRNAYGISLTEYNGLLAEQNGVCFICHKHPRARALAVDHDHALYEHVGIRDSVRGLLCRDCNEFIGRVGDDPEVGKRMSEYLTRPHWAARKWVQ